MPKLPVVSGRQVVSFMQSLGYNVTRQRGSHIRLELKNDRGTWAETVPDHPEVSKGTLRGILRRIEQATGIPASGLIERLGSF